MNIVNNVSAKLSSLIPRGRAKLMASMDFVIKSREFAIALVILAAFLALAVIAYYCITVRYPRPFLLGKGQNLSKIMADIHEDMNVLYHRLTSSKLDVPVKVPLTIKFIEDSINVQSLESAKAVKTKSAPYASCKGDGAASAADGYNLPDKCYLPEKVAGAGRTLDPAKVNDGDCIRGAAQPKHHTTLFEMYLMHEDIVGSMIDGTLFKVLHNYKQYSACGRDNAAGQETVAAAIARVRDDQKELEAAVVQLDTFERPFEGDKAGIVDYCVAIRQLHFYICTSAPPLKAMYDSRRMSMFNFLFVLINPFIDKFLYREIWSRWADALSKDSISEARSGFGDWWQMIKYGKDGSKWPGVMPGKMIPYLACIINRSASEAKGKSKSGEEKSCP